jgi:transcriptional regulator with XRE-family HTH domain
MTPDELKAAREALEMTQDELARLMGTNARTVGGWEQGERNRRPAPIPAPVALIVELARMFPNVRRYIKKRTPKGP